MKKQIIEPSEIITGEASSQKTNLSRTSPWIRLIARFFDYALFFTLLRLFVPRVLEQTIFDSVLPLEFLLWVPIETVFLVAFGATPGKLLLGIKLILRYKKRIAFLAALKRSVFVWFRGLGMGIPFISFFCMVLAYYRLRIQGIVSWDLDAQMILQQKPIALWRLYVASSLTILGLIFYAHGRSFSMF